MADYLLQPIDRTYFDSLPAAKAYAKAYIEENQQWYGFDILRVKDGYQECVT